MVLLHQVHMEMMEELVLVAASTALEAAVVLVAVDLMEPPVLVVMVE